MKVVVSLSAATRFASKQRVLVRLAKNEWYAATVKRVGKIVSCIADNGETFTFDLDEPARYVKIVPILKVFKKPLSDEQVKNLLSGVSNARSREAKKSLPKAIQAILTKFKVSNVESVTFALYKKILASVSDAQAVAFKRFMVNATKGNPRLNTAIKGFNIEPKDITVKVTSTPKIINTVKPAVTKIIPSGTTLKLQDVYLPEVEDFHDSSIPDEFSHLVKFSESADKTELETRVKLVADSVEKLRKADVYRLLEENLDVMADLAAYIARRRPDLKGEIGECLTELGE